MGWTMFYLFVVLKVPLFALCWICWWAIQQAPDDYSLPDDDGGSRRPPHPRRPLDQPPRRGPHGDPAPTPPERVRRPVAKRSRAWNA